MVIELSFVFALSFEFGNLLQRVEHRLDDPLVRSIDTRTYLQVVRTNKLVLNAGAICGKVLHEMCNALPLLAREFRSFNALELFGLTKAKSVKYMQWTITTPLLTT